MHLIHHSLLMSFLLPALWNWAGESKILEDVLHIAAICPVFSDKYKVRHKEGSHITVQWAS